MKHKQGSGIAYIQLNRKVFLDEAYFDMSFQCKWIYTILTELEHRYTGKNETFFFRSDKDLADDCGMGLTSLKKYKKELLSYDGIVQTWRMHWIDPETKKKSEKAVTAYRLL